MYDEVLGSSSAAAWHLWRIQRASNVLTISVDGSTPSGLASHAVTSSPPYTPNNVTFGGSLQQAGFIPSTGDHKIRMLVIYDKATNGGENTTIADYVAATFP